MRRKHDTRLECLFTYVSSFSIQNITIEKILIIAWSIQSLGIWFRSEYIKHWNTLQIFSFVANIASYLHISEFSKYLPTSIIYAIVIIVITVVVIQTIIISYIYYKFLRIGEEIQQNPIFVFFVKYTKFYSTVLYLLYIGALSIIGKCYFASSTSEIKCSGVFAQTLLGLAIVSIFACFCLLLICNQFMVSCIKTEEKFAQYQVLQHLILSVMDILAVCALDFGLSQNILLVLYAFIALVLLLNYRKCTIYSAVSLNKLFIGMLAIRLYVVCSLLIQVYLIEYDTFIPMVLFFICVPYIIQVYYSSSIYSYSAYASTLAKDGLHEFMICLSELDDQRNSKEFNIYNGIFKEIKLHKLNESEISEKEELLKLDITLHDEYSDLVLMLFKYYTFSKVSDKQLLMEFFNFVKSKSDIIANVIFSKYSRGVVGLQDKILRDQMDLYCKQHYNQLENLNINISSNHILDLIFSLTNIYSELWTILVDAVIDYNKTLKYLEIASKLKKDIYNYIDNFPQCLTNSKAVAIFKLFCVYVENYEKSDIEKVISNLKIKSGLDFINFKTFKRNDIATVIVSLHGGEIGIIKDANSAAANLFGYPCQYFSGQNINELMPNIYWRMHTSTISERKDSKISQLVRSSRQVLAKHSSGYIIPVDKQIKSYLDIRNSHIATVFLMVTKYYETSKSYMIVNVDGSICNISSQCLDLFSLSINSIKNLAISINSFFLGFDLSSNKPIKSDVIEISTNSLGSKKSTSTNYRYVFYRSSPIYDFDGTKIEGYKLQIEEVQRHLIKHPVLLEKQPPNFILRFDESKSLYVREEKEINSNDIIRNC